MADHTSPVAVTGIGVVSPIGLGPQEFWAALSAGRSGIAPIDNLHGSSIPPTVAAQVHGFTAKEFIRSMHLRRMDKLSRMIVAASRMALDDARVPRDRLPPESIGVVVGSALGNMSESIAHLERVFGNGPPSVSPMMFPNLVLNAPASYVGMELEVTGVNLTVAQGEISGEQAIILGCQLVRSGRAQMVLAGGGDELALVVLDAYRRVRALSGQQGGPQWCSPYDAKRNGVVLGEGAAILALESAAHARERGVSPYAEIEGDVSFGVPAPLYDWPAQATTALEPLRRLLGSHCDDVDLVCGAANSSRRLDHCEIDLLSRLFEQRAGAVTLTSVKGATGEFGAAGALSAAAACLALREQIVPPLCHLREPEPGTALQLAARRGESRSLDRAMLCGIARGGAGAALLLRRARDGAAE